MQKKKLPIGISDFKELRERNYYYVDKSLLIHDVLESGAKVILLPRPRRFGKTLNISMLRYFFEKTESSNLHLFDGLAIADNQEILSYQGQYPVIYLTFKDVKESSWESCYKKIQLMLFEEFQRHQKLCEPVLTGNEKSGWDAILEQRSAPHQLENALRLLISLLHRATGKQVILLLDEYDAPIHAGYQYDYYDEVILFMRNLLSGALKDNTDLEKGVMTGILRIAKESIFSGLNNLGVYSLIRQEFSDFFGFTQSEVNTIIKNFSIENGEGLKNWYNGYRFGEKIIYNPWSILGFLDSLDREFRAHWVNTSANELIRDLITRSDSSLQQDVETLLAGGTVLCPLDDNIALRDIAQNHRTIWNFLVFSGYLKPIKSWMEGTHWMYELAIPNLEVRSFYEDTIHNWISQQVGSNAIQDLLHSLVQEDIRTFGKQLRDIIVSTLSFHDTAGKEPERVYHAFVLGMLTHLSNTHQVKSNRESGYGRYDVLLFPKNRFQTGFVLEFKKIDYDDEKDHQETMQSALTQIREKEYAVELRNAGVNKALGIGIVVDGKQVWVESINL
ncbi:AAA family ATPase [Deltaproteobacteria bacterium TL4]